MTEKIDFTKDSEYKRLFDKKKDKLTKAECFNAIVEGMKILGWGDKDEKKQ